jgi:Na+/phosphate symporter
MEYLYVYIAVLLIVISFLAVISLRNRFKKKQLESNPKFLSEYEKLSAEIIFESCSETVVKNVISISKLYFLSLYNFTEEKQKELSEVKKEIKTLSTDISNLKKNLFTTIRKLDDSELESGFFYIQILDYIREATNCLQFIITPVFNHIENKHAPLPKDQAGELVKFNEKMSVFFNYSLNILKNNKFDKIPELIKLRNELIDLTIILKKSQIQFLKKEGKGTKVSLVFLEVMTESKNLSLFVTNIIEAQKEFVEHTLK